MSQYQVHCPSCQTSFQASDEHAGASTQCQNCQSYFTVPTREQAIILTSTLTQLPIQAPVVPKWYTTLTIMGPLCACLLLIGGGATYWIYNNRTVDNVADKHHIEAVKPKFTPPEPAKELPVVQPEEPKVLTQEELEQLEIRVKLRKMGLNIIDDLPAPDEEAWITLFDGKTIYGNPKFTYDQTYQNGLTANTSYSNKLLNLQHSEISFSALSKRVCVVADIKLVNGQNYSLGLIDEKKRRYYAWCNSPRHYPAYGIGTYDGQTWANFTTTEERIKPTEFSRFRYKLVDGNHQIFCNDKLLKEANEDSIQGNLNPYIGSHRGTSQVRNIKIKLLNN